MQDTVQMQNYQQELVSLLAACAEGDDRYIESMCQTIMGLDDALHILNNKNIPTANKGAYIKFVSGWCFWWIEACEIMRGNQCAA